MLEKMKKASKKDLSYEEFMHMSGSKGSIIFLNKCLLQDISVVINNCVNMLLQPEMIVLGHDCIEWQDSLVARLEDIVNEKKLANDNQRILVRKAYFGKNAF